MKPDKQPKYDKPKIQFLEWQGVAKCPGSCGELVQGTWNGINFLVPCPINLFSQAKVKLRPSTQVIGPSDKPKATLAVRKTLSFLGCQHLGGELHIETGIPAGKGMASSTADIGAAIGATADALGVDLSPKDLAQIAISIEPTDGTLLPGITLLDHVKGQWILPLGIGPAVQILVVDQGGEVDTLQFNSLPNLAELNRINESKTKQAFHLVRRGIQEKRPDILGQGVTLSAEANQTILWKSLFYELKAWTMKQGCLGVIAAHSGTVLGLLYPLTVDLELVGNSLLREFPEICRVWKVQMIAGGVKTVFNCKETERQRSEIHRPGGEGIG